MTATLIVPQRIRLSRSKGFRLHGASTNPNGVVNVARPSKWGNPFTVAKAREAGYVGTDTELRSMSADLFRRWLHNPEVEWFHGRHQAHWIKVHVHELAGKDLACWCAPGQPCHAEVLLAIANGWEVRHDDD